MISRDADDLASVSLLPSERRDPHGSVKQVHHEKLEGGDEEWPSAFSRIMLKQADSGIQQLHGAGERTPAAATQASTAYRSPPV